MPVGSSLVKMSKRINKSQMSARSEESVSQKIYQRPPIATRRFTLIGGKWRSMFYFWQLFISFCWLLAPLIEIPRLRRLSALRLHWLSFTLARRFSVVEEPLANWCQLCLLQFVNLGLIYDFYIGKSLAYCP